MLTINQYNYSLDNYASSQELMVTITLHEYRELVKEFSTKDAEISKIRCEKYDLEKEVKTQKEAYEELQKNT